ncbi:MAG: ABC transporter ATP-binding protein [Clostridia bacterium]|nr:ABC transporter ATP-binding protein [Clostridia bacterium]
MIRKFAAYYKPHLKLFILDMICAVAVAGCSLGLPVIVNLVTTDYALRSEPKALIIGCSVLLGLYVLKAFLNFFIQYWGHVVGVRMQMDMRNAMFKHLQRLPFKFFDDNKVGTIMSRIINDLFEISELAHHGPEDLFVSIVTLIGACVFMAAKVSVWLMVIVLAVVPLIVVFAAIMRISMMKAFRRTREETGRLNSIVESCISGIRVSKAYTAADHEMDKFRKVNDGYVKVRTFAFKQMGKFFAGMTFFTDFMYWLMVFFAGLFCIYGIDGMTGAQIATVLSCVAIVINPIRTLTGFFEQVQNGMSGFERYLHIMDTPEEPESVNAKEFNGINDSIEFDNVCFSYSNEESKKEVLHDLSFKVKKGETIALVGASGGGKTTVCHLIPRFYEISAGSIKIDGVDTRDYTKYTLRKQIGMVAQEVFLFGGSIKDNIAYGNLDATDEEIIDAAKKANIHEFAMSLPNGYDTEVGERGVKLSGGQKQRISIARAFLKNPPILILDEATSALDNVTEMQIQASLEKLSIGRTTIVVAHRLSTVKNADEIIVLGRDGIEERGTHDELIVLNGVYANLYQYQFRE